ncbi:magnesium transporter [Dietzia maris]|jgi:magnesium transporter|uniref:magnesium transporter n=1 Tax=Dietzia maris TaxID=37915 RepID=UPI00104E3218|nr:magnesium transporter [Dietzia maris]MCT1434294.1 magnesium transporter [Dietzia maris]MCT1521263.1 magnesium transporter [Dietzia maris]
MTGPGDARGGWNPDTGARDGSGLELDPGDPVAAARQIDALIDAGDLHAAAEMVEEMPPWLIVGVLERSGAKDRAVLFRLLSKGTALVVFEALDPPLQSELIRALHTDRVNQIFTDLDPDDRAGLIDELPARVATRLMRELDHDEQALTAAVLDYPVGSVGRRMSPEFISTHPGLTAGETLERVRQRIDEAETIYAIPVTDDERRLVGIVGLRAVMRAEPQTAVHELMNDAITARARESAETAARRSADERLIVMPVVDDEGRLVGILTFDDALRVLEDAESEDTARAGGSEPLRRPYLATPVRTLVRSRVVWLLVLALGAALTVQVLEVFESTLEQVVALSLFVPLIIGTGGNTGNQAATTVTRALALGDVRPRDVLRVLAQEVRAGATLGLILGTVGLIVAGLVYGTDLGMVIGFTLLALCTIAATVGGLMPLLAQAVRADPAVFSNPFITTFVDATGLIVYFLIARAVLGL